MFSLALFVAILSRVALLEQRSGVGGVVVGAVFPSLLSSLFRFSMANSWPCAAAFVHHSRATSKEAPRLN